MTRLLPPSLAAAAARRRRPCAATYSAKPLAARAAKRIVARDISWNCGPDACHGATDDSRPLVLCQGLAKRAGRLESFVVDGRAFAAAELDKCNSAARGGTAAALADAN